LNSAGRITTGQKCVHVDIRNDNQSGTKKEKVTRAVYYILISVKAFKDAVNNITKHGNRKVTYSSTNTSKFIYIKVSHTFSSMYHSMKQFPYTANKLFFNFNTNAEIGKPADSSLVLAAMLGISKYM
jgi:hypothetical protein